MHYILIIMQSILVIFGAVLCASTALPSSSEVFGADTSKWVPFVCRNGILSPNDDRMKGLGACAASHGPGKANNVDCIFFCQAIELGLLDKNGLPKTEIYDQWVDVAFPKYKEIAMAHFRECHKKYDNLMAKSDTTCAFSKAFGPCTWSVQPQLVC